MDYRRIWLLVNILPILLLGGLEGLYWQTQYFYQILAGIFLVLFAGLYLICRRNALGSPWWNFSVLPVVALAASVAYSTLTTFDYLVHAIYVVVVFFILLHLRAIFYLLYQPSRYKLQSIENSSNYINFFSFYLLSAALFGFRAFLSMPDWQVIVIVVLFSAVILTQLVWALKIEIKEAYIQIVALALVIGQLAWSISLLPFNYNVSGLILALTYYSLSNILKLNLTSSITPQKLRHYAYFITVSLIAIFLTARWL